MASKCANHKLATTLAFDYAVDHKDATKEKLLQKRAEFIREADKIAQKNAKGCAAGSSTDTPPKRVSPMKAKAKSSPKSGSPKNTKAQAVLPKKQKPKSKPTGSLSNVAKWFMGKENDDDDEDDKDNDDEEKPDEPEFGMEPDDENSWFDLLGGSSGEIKF